MTEWIVFWSAYEALVIGVLLASMVEYKREGSNGN